MRHFINTPRKCQGKGKESLHLEREQMKKDQMGADTVESEVMAFELSLKG